MSSAACTILGTAVLALLLAGYLAQHYLPPPKPRIVGIDLGTTYSCIGVYHAVTGNVDVLEDLEGHKCIPSVVAFNGNDIVVGYKAAAQADHNPENTIYDAKRFIGKYFTREDLAREVAHYPFKVNMDHRGVAKFVVGTADNKTQVTSEFIGSRLLTVLKETAERNISTSVTKAVMSVPAEFDEHQRNATKMAARMAGIDVLRVINEPTAAALAYGLHKKDGVHSVLVVDLGGGTLDVSLLMVQGGMFLTQAMAGNNHLGGQDFNQRLLTFLLEKVEKQFNKPLVDAEDQQALRVAVESAKLLLTFHDETTVRIPLQSFKPPNRPPPWFKYTVTKTLFEDLNMDLFKKVLEPIDKVLEATSLDREEVDEIVLVGGSTRIPIVRKLIRDYFQKEPNVSIDPELAVASGVAIQAGIMGGMWPLTVSATEIPTKVKKIHVT